MRSAAPGDSRCFGRAESPLELQTWSWSSLVWGHWEPGTSAKPAKHRIYRPEGPCCKRPGVTEDTHRPAWPSAPAAMTQQRGVPQAKVLHVPFFTKQPGCSWNCVLEVLSDVKFHPRGTQHKSTALHSRHSVAPLMSDVSQGPLCWSTGPACSCRAPCCFCALNARNGLTRLASAPQGPAVPGQTPLHGLPGPWWPPGLFSLPAALSQASSVFRWVFLCGRCLGAHGFRGPVFPESLTDCLPQ